MNHQFQREISNFFGNFLPILGGTVESFCAASDRSNSNSGKSRDCAHLRNQLDPIPDEFDRLSVTTIQTFHSKKNECSKSKKFNNLRH